MMCRPKFVLAGIVCLSLLITVPARGQAVYGNIIGTLTDPQGAAVPNAKVTVKNVRKGTTDTVTTNESGNYSVTHLIPDVYDVTMEQQGFQTIQQRNVNVSADTSVRLDGRFQVGSTSQTIEVTTEAPQLQTDRADIAVQFNQRYVENLPILNRNFTTFELLSPGTQKLVGWSHASTENPQGSQQIFVNGQHFSGTAFELDGTDNQDPILGVIIINPNLDAITETKVALQNYDAEFGKAVAGIVTAQTKSGSNNVHGSAFWFRRTDALQARNPFTQFEPDEVTGKMIPTNRWNQFGGSIGGPIIKDKLFFFGDYQGTRQTVGTTHRLTVPTARVLDTCQGQAEFCDLSEYLGAVGGGGQVFDPASSPDLSGGGRTPFAGNLVPAERISPQAMAILALFPRPNGPGVTNNYIVSGSGPFEQNAFDVRIDYSINNSMTAFGRYSQHYFNLSGTGAFGPLGGVGFGLGGLAGTSVTHNYSLASGITKTFSPTLLADFRFGWFKYNPMTHKLTEGTTPATDLGIPNANMGDVFTSGLPAFFMDNDQANGTSVSNFGEGLNVGRCNCPLIEREQQFQWVTNWTKTAGNHQIKFGGDIRYALNLRVPSDANRTGQFNFSHLNTSNAGDGGLSLATLLLGNVTRLERYVSTSLDAAERQKRWFFYGQDNWRATPKLTLSFGLRWEIYFPERVNGTAKGGFANIEEGIIRVAGVGGYGLDGDIDNTYKAFAPRIGVAYQITPKTVIRMGYGRSFDIGVFGSNFGHTVTQNLPVLVNQVVTATTNNQAASADFVTAFTLAQGPPPYPFPAIPENGQFPLQGPTGDISPKIRPTFQRLPTLDNWNLTIQRQVTATTSVEVAYLGNKGTHTFVGNGPAYNANPVALAGFGIEGVSQASRRPFFNRFTYAGYTDPVTGQTLMCCSTDLGNYLANDASNNYNALQVKVEKRYSQGLQFLAHYTWSKTFNYTDTYYAIDPRFAYGPYDFSRDHVFVTNVVYDLPFGRGRAFAKDVGRGLDAVIGGWQITATSNISSGLPFTLRSQNCDRSQDVGVCRPNKGTGKLVTNFGGFDPINHVVQYFSPQQAVSDNAYTDEVSPTGAIGNAGRNQWHGPGAFTTDASVMKNFTLTERWKGQFRMDVFNLFNHPVYGFSNTQGNLCVNCVGTNAGQITDIENGTTMRQVQFAVRLTF